MTTVSQSYPKIGDQAPDFTLPSLDGEPISLSSFRGRKIIVFMWASW